MYAAIGATTAVAQGEANKPNLEVTGVAGRAPPSNDQEQEVVLPSEVPEQQQQDGKQENDNNSPSPNTSSTKKIDIVELVNQLESSIQAETTRYRNVVYSLWVVAIIFILIWIVGLPIAIAFTEDWTYASAWYFSIQAGFGIGYGALTVQTQGMEIFLIIHLTLGAICIAFLVAYLLSRMIDKTDEKRKVRNARVVSEEELGQPVIGWRSWIIGSILLLVVLAAGVLYGMLYEKWNFFESLYFVISTCQTSGLLAPTIRAKDPDNIFAPVFVSFLVVLAVPLWAYNIGKASVELVNLDRAQRRQSSVMKRDSEAQEGFLRLAPLLGIDVSDPDNIQTDLAGFMIQLLLFNKMASEKVIADTIKEFNSYLEPGSRGGTAPQWKIVARVRFLQLCQLGLLEREDWDVFCDEARNFNDKSVILHGSTMLQDAVGESTSFKDSDKMSMGLSELIDEP